MKKQNTQSSTDEGTEPAAAMAADGGYQDTFTDVCVVSEDQIKDEAHI